VAIGFARNASSTALTQGVRGVFGLAAGILITRWLSEADRGLYAIIATLGVVGDQLGQVGMRFTVIYRMTRPGASRPRAVGAAVELTVTAFALIALFAFVFGDELRGQVLQGAAPVFLVLAVALAAADSFAGLSDAIARGIDRFDLRNANQLSIPIMTLVASALALLWLQTGVLGALVATAVGRWALLVLFFGLTLRNSGFEWTLDRRELRESLEFGWKGYLQTLLAKVHERADVVIMAALQLDPAQIAIYAVGVSVVDRLRVVPEAFSSALLPTLATMPPGETGSYTARVTRHLVFWVVLSGAALALAAPFLVPLLFGARYARSVVPLFILLPATGLLAVRSIVSNYFVAIGRPGFNAAVQAFAVAVNVALNFWAIPRFGIVGAAWTSVLSYSIEAGATVLAFERATSRGLRDTLVLQRRDLLDYAGRARRLLGGA